MAVGIPFDQANTVLRAPTPEDAAAGTVYDLHVHRYRDLDGRPNVISKWRFTPTELAQVVANGGEFWFGCWGETHPPMWIAGASPFETEAAPRRMSVQDEDFDTGTGSRVTVYLDGVEMKDVTAYDMDAGTVTRLKLDDSGHIVTDGENIVFEVLSGRVEASIRRC